MNDLRKGYIKLMDGIATVEKVVASVVLVFVTVIVFLNVVVRKFTTYQFAWTEELVINLFVLLIMLGCALAIRDEGGLVSLSLIFDRLPLAGRKAFVCVITGANLIFWCILLVTGMQKVATQIANGKHTSFLVWPEWVFTIFLPIGALFLILHSIEFFLNYIFFRTEEHEEGGEDA